jgi:hypothetical protein
MSLFACFRCSPTVDKVNKSITHLNSFIEHHPGMAKSIAEKIEKDDKTVKEMIKNAQKEILRDRLAEQEFKRELENAKRMLNKVKNKP